MIDDKKNIVEDDDIFAESAEPDEIQNKEKWKMIIADDEEDIHHVTRLLLNDFSYHNKKLEFLSAYSGHETIQMITENPDVAVILLDVVMETKDAGLRVVKEIRESLKNSFVRIILRTGQPGHAPEEEVIVKYEINDYKNKTELTDRKLFTSIISSLRSYDDLITIDAYRAHLEEMVDERTKELNEKNNKLLDLNKELVELNKEKNEFLSIAAHDLKNPLTVIRGYAEIISDNHEAISVNDLIRMADLIGENSQRMFELITNLLDVNKIESGKTALVLNKIDVAPLMKESIVKFESAALKKEIKINNNIPSDNIFIMADKMATEQIIDNLISNAIKYTPLGKNIFLHIQKMPHIVQICIEDEGPGLTENDQANLFGKFARLSARPTANEHSTGLGLFIVKKLVTDMQGKVWCDSTPGKGAKFFLEFPLFEEKQPL